MALRKRYGGFRLALIAVPETAAPAPPAAS
jgi:hypothetical protein